MMERGDFKFQRTYAADPYQNIEFTDQSCVLSLLAGPSRGVITISLLNMVEGAVRIFQVCETGGRGGEEELVFGWHLGVAKNTALELPSRAALQL